MTTTHDNETLDVAVGVILGAARGERLRPSVLAGERDPRLERAIGTVAAALDTEDPVSASSDAESEQTPDRRAPTPPHVLHRLALLDPAAPAARTRYAEEVRALLARARAAFPDAKPEHLEDMPLPPPLDPSAPDPLHNSRILRARRVEATGSAKMRSEEETRA